MFAGSGIALNFSSHSRSVLLELSVKPRSVGCVAGVAATRRAAAARPDTMRAAGTCMRGGSCVWWGGSDENELARGGAPVGRVGALLGEGRDRGVEGLGGGDGTLRNAGIAAAAPAVFGEHFLERGAGVDAYLARRQDDRWWRCEGANEEGVAERDERVRERAELVEGVGGAPRAALDDAAATGGVRRGGVEALAGAVGVERGGGFLSRGLCGAKIVALRLRFRDELRGRDGE